MSGGKEHLISEACVHLMKLDDLLSFVSSPNHISPVKHLFLHEEEDGGGEEGRMEEEKHQSMTSSSSGDSLIQLAVSGSPKPDPASSGRSHQIQYIL